MAGEWVKKKIGALGRVVTGKTPPTSDPANFGGPYPFITIPDLDGRVAIDHSERTLSQKGADILKSCLLPPGSVMMSCIATVGKCGITTKPSFTNQQINSVIPTKSTDARFLYYVFTQLGNELESAGGGGSVYTNVSKSRFADIEVMLPKDVGEQRAIAHILGTLDDKIELNRRMSQTLEEMARAIFKSWFVDFDPVRAKAAVRREHPDWTNAQVSRAACPNLKPEIAELFPDRFVDSELGEIPEGWGVGILSELIEVNPVRSLRKGHIAPYLDMANMPTKEHSPDQVTNRSFGSGMRFMNGDTLVARITPCLENGKTAFVDFLQEGQIGWGSTEFIVLRPKPPLPEEFAYCLARSSTFREFAIKSMTGSSGRQRVPAESLSHFQLVAPSKPIAEAFGIQVKPLFERAKIALQELRITTALRDVVLPKLISGEIRINDAEKFLRERDL